MDPSFSVRLWLCVWVSFTSARELKLLEGETCKNTDGVAWTCSLLRDCPTALADVINRNRPEICGFKGIEVVVCCKPHIPGEKSREMCKQYAESVFIRIPDLITDDLTSFDTCNVGESHEKHVLRRKKRVSNGKRTRAREYPHMAGIFYGYRNETSIDLLCGGTLISDRFVMGAAHCTLLRTPERDLRYWVRLGDLNIRSEKDDDMNAAQTSDYEIDEIIVHPEFNETSNSMRNDIALFRLKESVRFTEFIRPICLNTEKELTHSYALATGWGHSEYEGPSDVLKSVNLTIIPQRTCNSYARHGAIVNFDLMLCAGDLLHGRNICKGDSGGPLQVPLEEPYCMYSQIGISSWSPKACENGLFSVYTRVSYYIPWIESIVWPQK